MASRRLTALVFVLAFAAVGALPHTAHAQTPQQRIACQDDAYRFCGQYIPNHELIRQCLVRNLRNISRACRAQFRRPPRRSGRRR